MFLFWHGCRTRGGPHDAMTPSGGASAHLGTFLRVSPPTGSATALGVTFWVPTHAPNHLVTHSESVSAFLLHPAPGYPGRDLPLGSYLSRRHLWGGRGTSRVRLPYPDAITMALKPPFNSLYHFPELSGPEAFPRCRSLHGLSYPWVSGNRTVIALFLHCFIWRRPSWATGDAFT